MSNTNSSFHVYYANREGRGEVFKNKSTGYSYDIAHQRGCFTSVK
jgi:hypothetical protein